MQFNKGVLDETVKVCVSSLQSWARLWGSLWDGLTVAVPFCPLSRRSEPLDLFKHRPVVSPPSHCHLNPVAPFYTSIAGTKMEPNSLSFGGAMFLLVIYWAHLPPKEL